MVVVAAVDIMIATVHDLEMMVAAVVEADLTEEAGISEEGAGEEEGEDLVVAVSFVMSHFYQSAEELPQCLSSLTTLSVSPSPISPLFI